MQVVKIFYLSYWETHKGVFTNYGEGGLQKGVMTSFSHAEGGHKVSTLYNGGIKCFTLS